MHLEISGDNASPVGEAALTDNVFRLPPGSQTVPDLEDNTNPAVLNSEDWLAVRFANAYGKNLRYVAAWGKWLEWGNAHWTIEHTFKVFYLSRKICREAAIACSAPVQARGLAKAKTVAAVEQLSRSDREIASTKDQWDLDEFFFSPKQSKEMSK